MNKEKRVGRYREQMEWLIYASAYLLSFLLARGGHSYGSGFVLIAAALCLYGIISIRTGDLVNLEGLLSLSFIGGQGVACLKLSHLQQNWNLVTWLCFFLVYCCFRIGYQLGKGKKMH